MPRSGDKLGPYILRNKLGRGGFGEVWLADNPSDILYQQVAVKLPHDEDVNLETIRQEAKLWREVSGHPNIVPFIEAKIYDGQIVIVSEYAENGSLSGWLKRNGDKAPSLETAVQITSGILDGLIHLHSRRIVHRDLKPANILLQKDVPRLADFGLSKLVDSSRTPNTHQTGTTAFMPPEAFYNRRSIKTDIWSVGIIFYLLLAGRHPFDFEDEASLISAILNNEPNQLPSGIPFSIQEFIQKALRKTPEDRFKSAIEMREVLEELLPFSSKTITDKNLSLASAVTSSDFEDETLTRVRLKKSLPKRFKNEFGIEFRLVPRGKFLMGTHPIENVVTQVISEKQRRLGLDEDDNVFIPDFQIMSRSILREMPQHLVEISYPLYFGVCTISQKQWEALMNNNPSFLKGGKLPVDGVSWYDAKEFISRLNERSDDYFYRLPSEAEWEYACRANTSDWNYKEFNFPRFNGDDLSADEANFNGQSLFGDGKDNTYRKQTVTVRSLIPNAWGLYNMHGNVWEWCEDIFAENYVGLPNDGSPNLMKGDEKLRVLRGGSWGVSAFSCRSAYRGRANPETVRNCNGFRIVAIPKLN